MKLTDKIIKELPAAERGNRIAYDDTVRGLGIRVTSAGARAFVLNYYASGRERRYTIGAYPDWPLAAARTEARKLKLGLRANGSDPLARVEVDRSAPTTARPLRAVSRRTRHQEPVSGGRGPHRPHVRAASLRAQEGRGDHFSDCDGVHRKITKRGTKHRANRVIALLSKAFNLSIRWGWRLDNPCKGIERNPENKRTRYLKGDQLKRASRGRWPSIPTKTCQHHPSAVADRRAIG